MRPLRVYVDTSIFGGKFEIEHAKETKRFLKRVDAGQFRLVVSDQVDTEIAPSPPDVQQLYKTMMATMERLAPSPETKILADHYIAHRVLTEKYRSDATHIAYATIYKCDGIISWNFDHMVDLNRSIRYNMINAENGHAQLFLASPREVEEHENTRTVLL